ncbi:MAG: hypothetical protein EB034_00700 [Verrucomicrobia bacterium]|nr:hypothetical protein [Verrucomicrobiota bacterium]
MADRWVETPHVFPNCCHRCLKSGADNGPYFHEEWDYCQPDRWPGVTPDSPRRARKFTCKSCFLYAASQPGAPLPDLSAKQLGEAEDRIYELEAALAAERAKPQYVDAAQFANDIAKLLDKTDKKPAARKPAAKKAAE